MSPDAIQTLKNQCDNYEQTVISIITFAHLLRYDNQTKELKPNTFLHIGRKMNTSSKNSISPEHEITPDILIQQNSSYGIIGEVKKSLPKNNDNWKKLLEQIQKYDDDLKGWKTSDEYIPSMDLVLLIDYLNKSEISDFFEVKIEQGELQLNKKFALIAFSRIDESETKLAFEKVYGDFSDPDVNQTLKKNRPMAMPLERVMKYYKNGGIKFYDSPPPVPYMMKVLWEMVFPSMKKIEDYIDESGKRQMKIDVNVNLLTDQLQAQFTYRDDHDSRQPDVPRTKWIKEAMEQFVRLGYAIRHDSRDDYTVKLKFLKEPFEKFCKEYIEGPSSNPTKQNTLKEWIE